MSEQASYPWAADMMCLHQVWRNWDTGSGAIAREFAIVLCQNQLT